MRICFVFGCTCDTLSLSELIFYLLFFVLGGDFVVGWGWGIDCLLRKCIFPNGLWDHKSESERRASASSEEVGSFNFGTFGH